MKSNVRNWVVLVVIALAVIAVDQGSKRLVVDRLDLGESRRPIPALSPFFQITRSYNTGAAFGFLPEVGDLFIIIAVGVVIALVVFYPRLPPEATPTRLALGLVVGGALGNALDRLQYGHVVDFIHYQIPGLISNVSNLADHAVVLGVIIILIDSWRIDRIRAQAEATASALAETTLDTDTSEYPPVERSQT
jgi:signal peptidase II